MTGLHPIITELADRRRALGLHQVPMAQRMGTTQSAISEMETGRTSPQLTTLDRCARVLGMRLTVVELVPLELMRSQFALEGRVAELERELERMRAVAS